MEGHPFCEIGPSRIIILLVENFVIFHELSISQPYCKKRGRKKRRRREEEEDDDDDDDDDDNDDDNEQRTTTTMTKKNKAMHKNSWGDFAGE